MTDRWLIILGLLVACVGAAVVALALFRDRSRGRRRCPRCWYDMSGTPGLTCSECGHTARAERRLFRTRRRWRRAAVGVLVILAGAGSGAGPTIYQHGWLAVVPTTLLLPFVPHVDKAGVYDVKTKRVVQVAVVKEMARRTAAEPLAGWQLRYLLARIGMVKYRRQSPADEPLVLELHLPHWLGCNWMQVRSTQSGVGIRVLAAPLSGAVMTTSVATLPVPTRSPGGVRERGGFGMHDVTSPFRVEFRRQSATTSSVDPENMTVLLDSLVTLPIELVPTGDEAVPPIRTPETDSLVRSSLNVRAFRFRSPRLSDMLCLRVEMDRDTLGLDDMAVVLHAELLDRDENLGETRLHLWEVNRSMPAYAGRRIERAAGYWITGPVPKSRDEEMVLEPGRYIVRIRGIDRGVLTDWDKKSRWGGELDYPLETILQPDIIPGDYSNTFEWAEGVIP